MLRSFAIWRGICFIAAVLLRPFDTHLETPAVLTQICDSTIMPAPTEALPLDINEIERRLQASSYLALRLVRCRFKNGKVMLDGRVPSYYLKQVAQTLANDAGAGLPIENRLEVA